MFVSCWSDIDVALSQVNVILSEVNSKLELCPAESRKNVLSRLSNILNEMMWTVSLSSEGSSDSDVSSSYSADVESMSWDNSEDLYRLYYDNDEDEDEDYENDDHGPIQFSDVEDQESSPHQSETNSNFVTKVFKTKASPEMIVLRKLALLCRCRQVMRRKMLSRRMRRRTPARPSSSTRCPSRLSILPRMGGTKLSDLSNTGST